MKIEKFAELRTQLYLAKEVGIISQDKADSFVKMTRKISGMIHRLIQSRQGF